MRRDNEASKPTNGVWTGWQEPGDDQLLWSLDRIHTAEPITPMEFSVAVAAYNPGFVSAAVGCGLPVAEIRSRLVNGYLYSAMVWQRHPAAQSAGGLEALRQAIAELPHDWGERWLPEIRRALADWEGFDLDRAGDAELMEQVRDSIPRLRRMFELHFRVTIPATTVMSQFEEFYREFVDDTAGSDPYALLGGFDNRSLERDRQLRRLARRVNRSTALGRIFTRFDGEELLERLAADDATADFMRRLDAFLDEFGAANDRPSLVESSWSERPGVPLGLIRTLSTRRVDSEPDPLEAAARRRDQAVEAARRKLADTSRLHEREFEFLLGGAQAGNVLLEDHAYWIDQKVVQCLRRLLLEAGKRLAGSALAAAEDVFLLSLDELLATAEDRERRWQSEIDGRRKRMEAWSALEPPPFLGRPPSGRGGGDPVSRAFLKVSGGRPPGPTPDRSELRGTPAAPGRVAGPARLIRSVADGDRIRPGDVLVAPATLPSWTPLFAIAAGLVTDEGGMLCHSACVAREYGLPAVVGTGCATRLIREGQRIEVDGSEGRVRAAEGETFDRRS